MAYEEVEKRRAMLQSLWSMLQNLPERELQLGREDILAVGDQLNLQHMEALRLFLRLLNEGYLRVVPMSDGKPYSTVEDEIGFYFIVLEDLTDKGMRAIEILPPEQSLEGLVVVLQDYMDRLEQQPLPPEEKERKRRLLANMIENVRDVAVEFGAKVMGELMAKSMGI